MHDSLLSIPSLATGHNWAARLHGVCLAATVSVLGLRLDRKRRMPHPGQCVHALHYDAMSKLNGGGGCHVLAQLLFTQSCSDAPVLALL
jgi:hypothetical protein